MPKVTQQHRDARREQILAAARRCFLRDGFHATSMQDLFAEAGLSSGAVYSYFASKDDVIEAIAEENMRGVTEMIAAVARQHPDRPVGDVLADIMDLLKARDERDGLGKLTVIVWSEALRNPSLAARFTAMVDRIRSSLAEVIERSPPVPPADPALPADELAATLICLVPGYLLQLAILGPAAVGAVPAAVRALFPDSMDVSLHRCSRPTSRLWPARSELRPGIPGVQDVNRRTVHPGRGHMSHSGPASTAACGLLNR